MNGASPDGTRSAKCTIISTFTTPVGGSQSSRSDLVFTPTTFSLIVRSGPMTTSLVEIKTSVGGGMSLGRSLQKARSVSRVPRTREVFE